MAAVGYMEFFILQLEQAILKILFGIDGNENSIIEEKHFDEINTYKYFCSSSSNHSQSITIAK